MKSVQLPGKKRKQVLKTQRFELQLSVINLVVARNADLGGIKFGSVERVGFLGFIRIRAELTNSWNILRLIFYMAINASVNRLITCRKAVMIGMPAEFAD